MKSELPPIDHTEDIEKYEAKHTETPVDMKRCTHERAFVQQGELRCPCGAAWTGPRIAELLQILTK